MEPEQENEPNPISIDVNSDDFYEKLQEEIESDLARIKKSIEVINNLRMTAAEVEVDTAALYHAELLKKIEDFKILNDTFHEEMLQFQQEMDQVAPHEKTD